MMSFSLTYIFIILVVMLSLYLLFSYRNFSEIPGNKYFIARPLPLIGNLIDFLKYTKKFGWPDCHIQMKKIYGNIYGYSTASHFQLAIHDSEILRHILFTDFNNFPNRRSFPFAGVLTRCVFRVEGTEWRKQRKLLSPAFSSGKLKEVLPSITACASKTAQCIINFANSYQSFEMRGITGAYTMDVIASSQFGLEIDAQNTDNNLFIKHAEEIMARKVSMTKSLMIGFTPWLLTLIGIIKRKEMKYHSDETSYFFQKIVRQIFSIEDGTEDIRPNIISILKKSQNADQSIGHLIPQQTLSEEEIIGNAALLIAAGYDTTAGTLGFLFYFFALYTDVQEKVLQEIQSVFGEDLHISYEKLAHLRYLDMCINETLRIYPPTHDTTRVALKECKYKDVVIPKKSVIIIPIRAIHMDPEIWPEPEKFNPERFSSDSKIDRDPTSFIPFGAGPRICIGIRLAFLEIKILVVELLREIEFIKSEKTEVPIKLRQGFGLLLPANGIWLKAQLRKNNDGKI